MPDQQFLQFKRGEMWIEEEFHPEGGGSIPSGRVVFHTAGRLNATCDNVVWICHALTANSNPGEWWPGFFEKNPLADPQRHFIICVNVPGSCYGSLGPLDLGDGTALYHRFPGLTIRDIVAVLQQVRKHLGINAIQTLMGASMGGQQALEWSILEPGLIRHLVLLATNARHSEWGVAFNESQRWAIENDPSWPEYQACAGLEGMKLARSLALLSYRSYRGYALRQYQEFAFQRQRKVASYQRYQGEKLAERFNAFSYHLLSRTMDSHDVGRDRGGTVNALSRIKACTLVLALKGDLLFPAEEQQYLAEHIPEARYREIPSEFGHDGFLIETEKIKYQLNRVFTPVSENLKN